MAAEVQPGLLPNGIRLRKSVPGFGRQCIENGDRVVSNPGGNLYVRLCADQEKIWWDTGFLSFFVTSMFISGGLIPTFLLYQRLGIYNTLLGLYSAGERFQRVLYDSVQNLYHPTAQRIGGGGFGWGREWAVYFRIVLPMSTPMLATVGLFVAVAQWSAWQDTLYYVTNPNLESLQFVLMKVLRQAEATAIAKQAKSTMMRQMRTVNITPDSIKMAITIVATLPILLVYPFLQKYFVKGMVLGAVKGDDGSGKERRFYQ